MHLIFLAKLSQDIELFFFTIQKSEKEQIFHTYHDIFEGEALEKDTTRDL